MTKSLLRSTSLFSANTLMSRLLGFARDIVFAHLFGAVAGFDAFIVAFKIPNFMRRLFAEGAFSQAFVPVLSEYRQTKSLDQVRLFISHIAGTLLVVLLLVTILGVLLSPLITVLFAPGFLHDVLRFSLSSNMLRITFPYILLISLTALSAAVLNSYDSFGVPAFNPVLLNLVLIFMAIVVAPYFKVPVYALAWGVFIAGIVQFIFLLPFLYRKQLLVVPQVNLKDKGVRKVLKLMVPAIVGVSAAQISILVDTIFASFLQTGSVSWLYYSDRLMNFPLGVFGVAIATVILPKLARHHAAQKHNDYSKTLDWALRLLLLIGVPSSIGLIILAGPLMSTLFQNGKFSPYDVFMARRSLMAFAIGIQAFMLVKVFASGFYARQDIKTPVKIAIMSVIINIALNFMLIFPLKHAGLALATSIASFFNSSILLSILIRRKIYKPQNGWVIYFLRLVLANGFMTLFLLMSCSPLSIWIKEHVLWRCLHLSYLVIVSMLIYVVILYITGIRLCHLRETT